MKKLAYVIGDGTVYEYEIPLGSFTYVSASAKYGENLSEDAQCKIWGSLSLGGSVQEAFEKAGLPAPLREKIT